MSGGNNATIAYPGPTWQMLWPYGFASFQLDIVGFLAVLGEGAISHNAQVSALSKLFYLPRLIPAPQALLWPNRPVTLPPTKANVTAVASGNTKDHIHHVAHVLLGDISYENESKTYAVRCVRVEKNCLDQQTRPTWVDRIFRGQQSKRRTRTGDVGSTVKAKATGPLSWVTLLGFFLSLSLFIMSIALGDGMSLIATLLLSFLSTLVGIGNKWELALSKREQGKSKPPRGDVVIRYANGSFLIVKCDEDVARELYFAPEEIKYHMKSPEAYRIISLIGTLMLMLGVISLANARLQLQIAWAAAYILMNAAQWTAAALPARYHWDLSCYTVTEEGLEHGPANKNFTDALWKAIMLTESTQWVAVGNAAPRTKTWEKWLEEADLHARHIVKNYGCLEDPNPHWTGGDPSDAVIWSDPSKWPARDAWSNLNQFYNPPKSESPVRRTGTV